MNPRWDLFLILAGLLVAAFSLRTGLAQVGPVIEQIRADTGMGSGVAGLLASLPYAAMGAFSFAGPRLIRTAGVRTVICAGLGLIAVAMLVRAAAGSATLIIALTLPLGVGMALVGIGIPVAIKQWFSSRAGAVTAGYTLSMALGLTIASLTVIPLAELLGGWRPALVVGAIPALAGVLLCLIADFDRGLAPASPPTPVTGPRLRLRPPPNGLRLGLIFGLQSFCFSSMLAWGAAVYIEAGWPPERAAFAISSLGILGVASSAGVSRIREGSDRRRWACAMLLITAAGLMGTALAPGQFGPAWMLIFGISAGATLPLLFVLPIGLGATAIEVSQMTAWMLGLGYTFSALGPVFTGLVRDLSGGFAPAILTLCLLSVAAALITLGLPRAGRGPQVAGE